eukprot:4114047-Pleurochrysis_carterae.AAC.1
MPCAQLHACVVTSCVQASRAAVCVHRACDSRVPALPQLAPCVPESSGRCSLVCPLCQAAIP